MTGRPAAGGGQWVDVAADRIGRWLAGFDDRHGGIVGAECDARLVVFCGADGALAECHPPFPPLAPLGPTPQDAVAGLVAHVGRARRTGVLLVRLGGYGAGVFDDDLLVASKVGSRLVHGRSAAGGQSQQRFARRRENQARDAVAAAADVAVRVLLPYVSRFAFPDGQLVPETGRNGAAALQALICGGDRRAMRSLRADARLAPLFALEAEPFLTVPDPRLAVLRDTPRLFRTVRIRVRDADGRTTG